ncbi:ARS-binding protein 1 [Phytophthora cinnamomi]|uniref:ARS-binding protein 1 n=1 Tax=Phytophthora cinnamomi TaxID=4785 RepID=UPI003559D5DF|nr:ARS-binding protein 1 [Phytophthora cinnamomi]
MEQELFEFVLARRRRPVAAERVAAVDESSAAAAAAAGTVELSVEAGTETAIVTATATDTAAEAKRSREEANDGEETEDELLLIPPSKKSATSTPRAASRKQFVSADIILLTQARVKLLLDHLKAGNIAALRKSGMSEEYERKRELLVDVQAKQAASEEFQEDLRKRSLRHLASCSYWNQLRATPN